MTSRFTRLAAATVGGFIACAAVVAIPTAAQAAGSTPPWEPDTNAVGTLTFYNASGTQVTSGDVTSSPIAAYAVGSAAPNAGDTKAQLLAAQPNPNEFSASSNPDVPAPGTSGFSTDALSAVTSFPVTGSGVPTAVSGAAGPVVTGSAADLSLANFINEFPNTGTTGIGCAYETTKGDPSTCTNANYENLYQLRVVTLNASGDKSATYDDADVLVSNATYSGTGSTATITSGTWTQVYPATSSTAVTTKTALSSNPASPSKQGTNVKFTATVTASDGSAPAGSVQFTVDGTNAGPAVAVTQGASSDTASLSTAAIPPGSYTVGAVFTPTDSTTYQASPQATLTYVVNPVATKPTISGTAKVGKTVRCQEKLTSGERATYAFKAGGKTIGKKQSLKLPKSAGGKNLTCTVTVSAPGATEKSSATSAAKKVAKVKKHQHKHKHAL